jgi:perosamine synthetase
VKIPQFMPTVGEDEYNAIKSCFDDNWITEGPKTQEFKSKLLDLTGAKFGEFAPNGTLAIYLALKAIGIQPGDEVLVPNFTFIASANAVVMLGAVPVFVDIDTNLQIDLKKCRHRLTGKTKAIMTAHMYGTCGDMTSVVQFAKLHNLKVIEDAAQAIGVKWDNVHAGTIGDVGTFSFFADKTITCGEGGFVVTNDPEIATNLSYLRNQGRLNRGTFIHPEIGFNFRITDIHSAMGLVQLEKLDDIISKKLKIFSKYKEKLKNIDGLYIFEPMKSSSFVPFRVCIINKTGNTRDIMSSLASAGIETRTFFYPLHKQPCFHCLSEKYQYNDNEFPISTAMFKNGICLPTFLTITDEQISYICDSIARAYKNV